MSKNFVALPLGLFLWFFSTACNLTPRTAESLADAMCTLIPVFDAGANGKLVGAFCADAVKLVKAALPPPSAEGKLLAEAPVTCTELVEVRGTNGFAGYACPAYAGTVAAALRSDLRR